MNTPNTHHPSIRQTLESLRAQGQTAFVPFIMGGDPNLAALPQILQTLVRAGAALIEVGVPFSDPIADGPTNQQAADRALASGTSLDGILRQLAPLELGVPVILFSYANPIFRMGPETFAQRAKAAGVAGVLIVDLPPEEAAALAPTLAAAELEWVSLASPTTPPERLARINALASGCVYYVARAGVTGARTELSETLNAELAAVRKAVNAPLIVGFGISSPEHVTALKDQADGVVVGSALVKTLAESYAAHQDLDRACQDLEDYVRRLTAPLKTTLNTEAKEHPSC